MKAKNNKNPLARAAKKKIILIITGVGIPLLFFIFLLCFLLLPVFSMGVDIYDHYSGAEDAGGIAMRISGRSILDPPLTGNIYTITSGFGMRYHPVEKTYKNHDGIDIACPQGSFVTAVSDGRVTFAGSSEGYGNLVIIKDIFGYEIYYGHLSAINVYVDMEVVRSETVIGYSGGTPGTPGAGTSTGPHLHFEVHKNGEPVDPAGLLGLVQEGGILPGDIMFKYLDTKAEDKVRDYLKNKNSLLAEEPYFTTIMETGKNYRVNPLLLFAITGQEQSFVPKTDSEASTIANNPFNVYGAWYQYNTNIADTAAIAAGTIINLSKDRPADADPIQWINTRGGKGGYAGDKNWWKGVSRFFNELLTLVDYEHVN